MQYEIKKSKLNHVLHGRKNTLRENEVKKSSYLRHFNEHVPILFTWVVEMWAWKLSNIRSWTELPEAGSTIYIRGNLNVELEDTDTSQYFFCTWQWESPRQLEKKTNKQEEQ